MGRRRERFRQVLEKARARRGVALMGICNVTPDSFSDGGRYLAPEQAEARVHDLLAAGADFIDVGGESTRPGAEPVAAREQIARVLGAVKAAVRAGGCVTIDTADPEVAAACLDEGACAVNDVSCLRDERLASVCASHDAAFVLMHSREPMSELKGFSAYPDDAYREVVGDVAAEWEAAAARAMARGLTRDVIVMDPGLGFAKNARQSMALLAATGTFAARLGVPICVGASRKSFLASSAAGSAPEGAGARVRPGRPGPGERIGASLAAALFAARSGASILRVHDVRETLQAIDLQLALEPDRWRLRDLETR